MSALEQISPYENIVIGNFLYGLGFNVARLTGTNVPPACINLLQQTPLDTKLSDVLLSLGGTVRLLEFKRTSNKSDKEENKVKNLRAVLQGQPHFIPVSHAVHWHILSGLSGEGDDFDVTLCRYLDIGTEGEEIALAEFTKRTAIALVTRPEQEPAPALIEQYLQCVVAMADAGSSSSGGILVNVSDTGQIRYVVVRDLLDLSLTHRFLLERTQEQTREICAERELEAERELARALQPTRDYGMDR